MKEFHGNAMIGMLASKIMIEGPIKKRYYFLYDFVTAIHVWSYNKTINKSNFI